MAFEFQLLDLRYVPQESEIKSAPDGKTYNTRKKINHKLFRPETSSQSGQSAWAFRSISASQKISFIFLFYKIPPSSG